MTTAQLLIAIRPRAPRPVWARRLPQAALVRRCLTERGEAQKRSIAELERRGLRLSASQRSIAGLPAVRGIA